MRKTENPVLLNFFAPISGTGWLQSYSDTSSPPPILSDEELEARREARKQERKLEERSKWQKRQQKRRVGVKRKEQEAGLRDDSGEFSITYSVATLSTTNNNLI